MTLLKVERFLAIRKQAPEIIIYQFDSILVRTIFSHTETTETWLENIKNGKRTEKNLDFYDDILSMKRLNINHDVVKLPMWSIDNAYIFFEDSENIVYDFYEILEEENQNVYDDRNALVLVYNYREGAFFPREDSFSDTSSDSEGQGYYKYDRYYYDEDEESVVYRSDDNLSDWTDF